MMQIVSVILITISIFIVIYALGDFMRNININNDVEVKNKLGKMKARMVLAIVVFIVPFALNLVVGIFNNVSKLFKNDESKLVEIDNSYLNSNYVWNDDKKYYENKKQEEIVEIVNVIDDVMNTSDINDKKVEENVIDDVSVFNNNTDVVEDISEVSNTIDREEISNNVITYDNSENIYNDKVSYVEEDINKDVSDTTNNITNNNEYKKSNTTDIKKEIDTHLLIEEDGVVENKINYNSNNIIVNSTNELIVNNQAVIKTIDSFTYYNQCDKQWQVRGFCSSGYSMCSNGCGATALAMVVSTLGNNKNVTPLDIRDYLCANKLHSNGGMTYEPFTNNELLNNYGLKANVFISYNDNSRYDDVKALAIKAEVEKGNGVILLIPGHYVVIGNNKSCSANHVYMYDPASRTDTGCYTMGELWTKTWNRKNRCYNKNKCGWRMAWSYTSK